MVGELDQTPEEVGVDIILQSGFLATNPLLQVMSPKVHPVNMQPLGLPDYSSVAIPDSPRTGLQLVAGGNTSLVQAQSSLSSSSLGMGEMAEMQQIEAILHQERAAACEVPYSQRQGYEHAARAFEIRANQDQQRAENRTSLRLRGEYEGALNNTRLHAEQEILMARQDIMHPAEVALTHEREMFTLHAKEIVERAYFQHAHSVDLAEGDIRKLQGELAGAEYELMHVKPAVAGQHEHNVQLTNHAENQQHYIQHLESALGQNQTQMARLQSGYEQLRSEMQNELSKSEN